MLRSYLSRPGCVRAPWPARHSTPGRSWNSGCELGRCKPAAWSATWLAADLRQSSRFPKRHRNRLNLNSPQPAEGQQRHSSSSGLAECALRATASAKVNLFILLLPGPAEYARTRRRLELTSRARGLKKLPTCVSSGHKFLSSSQLYKGTGRARRAFLPPPTPAREEKN